MSVKIIDVCLLAWVCWYERTRANERASERERETGREKSELVTLA